MKKRSTDSTATTWHKFDLYAKRKGHYPRFRRRHITVTIRPGYITLSSKLHDSYIPKDILIPLLRWLVPLVKQMGDSFDPEAAMSEYLAFLDENEKALRQQKGPKRKGRF